MARAIAALAFIILSVLSASDACAQRSSALGNSSLNPNMRNRFGRVGWYAPSSTHLGQMVNSTAPGWYRRTGVLAKDLTERQTGWYLPMVSATGRPTTGVNRPGWYLETNIPKQDRTKDARAATKMMEGYSIASARNASKPATVPQLMSDETIYLEDLQNEEQARARELLSQDARSHMRPHFTARRTSRPFGANPMIPDASVRKLSGMRSGGQSSSSRSGSSRSASSSRAR